MKPTKVVDAQRDAKREAYRAVVAVTESSTGVLLENVSGMDRLNAQILMVDILAQALLEVDARNMSLWLAELIALRRAQTAGDPVNVRASQRRQREFIAAAIDAARLRAAQPEGTA